MPPGRIIAIYVIEVAGGPPRSVAGVNVFQDRGLEGDRYCIGQGSFSRWPGEGRAISMIEQETIDAARREFSVDLSHGLHRRNLVTDGIHLADLNGKLFRAGTAVLRGVRVCAPCKYLERLVGPNTFASLKGRGGLRADVLQSGVCQVGDRFEVVTAPTRRAEARRRVGG